MLERPIFRIECGKAVARGYPEPVAIRKYLLDETELHGAIADETVSGRIIPAQSGACRAYPQPVVIIYRKGGYGIVSQRFGIVPVMPVRVQIAGADIVGIQAVSGRGYPQFSLMVFRNGGNPLDRELLDKPVTASVIVIEPHRCARPDTAVGTPEKHEDAGIGVCRIRQIGLHGTGIKIHLLYPLAEGGYPECPVFDKHGQDCRPDAVCPDLRGNGTPVLVKQEDTAVPCPEQIPAIFQFADRTHCYVGISIFRYHIGYEIVLRRTELHPIIHRAEPQIAFPVIKQVYENQGAFYQNILIPITDGKRVYNISCNLKAAYESECKEVVKSFEKAILLHVIDEAWKENLRELDELKHSVQNASYEQKDPLLIYKLESVNLFDAMVDKINNQTISILMRGQIPVREPQEVRQAAPEQRQDMSKYQEQKQDLSDPNQQAAASQDTREQPKREPIRVQKTVGRNDPCPCGSGKKYKNCHGKNL